LNELEIKQGLLSQLSKITLLPNGDTSVLLANDKKTEITVSKIYDLEKFRLKPGQFIQMEYGCSCHPQNKIGICVGVGKGCPKDKEADELWLLMEENDGIIHFCGCNKLVFDEAEQNGDLILLEAV